jgi:hypothetical protein
LRDDIQLICYPRDDDAFEAEVRAVLAGLPPVDDDGVVLVAAVAALRARYPNVRIRTRDPIAAFAADPPTWYVFRDGRASGSGLDAPVRRSR